MRLPIALSPGATDYALVHRRMSWAAVSLHVGLSLLLLQRVAAHAEGRYLTVVVALVTGVMAADFVSGFVHWLADHYGTTETFLFGPNIVRSFREHHVDPMIITRGDFITTNGDTSRITVPLLLLVSLCAPPSWLALNAFIVALCLFTLFTAQSHKWAHMEHQPPFVRWLQRAGVFISPDKHRRHHRPPFNSDYCITAGWFNPLLERTRFFRRLEWLVECCTGLKPL